MQELQIQIILCRDFRTIVLNVIPQQVGVAQHLIITRQDFRLQVGIQQPNVHNATHPDIQIRQRIVIHAIQIHIV